MKRIVLFVICLRVANVLTAQQSIHEYEIRAGKCYGNIDSFEYYIKPAIEYYESKNDYRSVGRCWQNLAFAYEEQRKNFEKAFVYAQCALNVYRAHRDKLQAANIYKYQGHLLGCMGVFKPGIELIRQSIKDYQKQRFKEGEIVAYFDLAILYRQMGDYMLAEVELKKCHTFWVAQNEPIRILAIDLEYLEYSYGIASEYRRQIIAECQSIIKNNIVQDVLKSRFSALAY